MNSRPDGIIAPGSAGAPVAGSGDYKRGMRRLASGVAAITTEFRGERFGLLSTSVTSVSAEPPVLLACIGITTSSHDPIVNSGRFCVNLLQQGDEDVAERFSSSQHRDSRFLGREWTVLTTRAPALVGCLASFDCAVIRSIAAGTHTVFFASVVDIRLWSDAVDPLMYWDGAYRTAAPADAALLPQPPHGGRPPFTPR